MSEKQILTDKQRAVLAAVIAESAALKNNFKSRIAAYKFTGMPLRVIKQHIFLATVLIPYLLTHLGEEPVDLLPQQLGPDYEFGAMELPDELEL